MFHIKFESDYKQQLTSQYASSDTRNGYFKMITYRKAAESDVKSIVEMLIEDDLEKARENMILYDVQMAKELGASLSSQLTKAELMLNVFIKN